MGKTEQKTIFSGVQPSGVLHIGTYFGTIGNWKELQNQYRSIFCVVDEHAITTPQEPRKLKEKILEAAALFLAAGIDPKKSIVFIQSHNQDHAELSWILNTLTPLGELERMTQFKDKAKNQKSVLAGLFNYPALMAADILLYQTEVVPVGEDQLQHIELTRMLAKKFNRIFGQTFKIPEALINQSGARIMGLDNPEKKMSKSAEKPENYIALLDSPDEIKRKIKIAVTDSGKEIKYDPKKKPAISNLLTIYHLSSGLTMKDIETRYENKNYSEFKNDLAELLVEILKPLQEKYNEIRREPDYLFKILKQGAEKAKAISSPTLKKVKEKIGFILQNT